MAAFCRAGVRAPNRDVCSLAVTMNRSAGQAAARKPALRRRSSKRKVTSSLVLREEIEREGHEFTRAIGVDQHAALAAEVRFAINRFGRW